MTRRPTASDITDDQLDHLYARLAHLETRTMTGHASPGQPTDPRPLIDRDGDQWAHVPHRPGLLQLATLHGEELTHGGMYEHAVIETLLGPLAPVTVVPDPAELPDAPHSDLPGPGPWTDDDQDVWARDITRPGHVRAVLVAGRAADPACESIPWATADADHGPLVPAVIAAGTAVRPSETSAGEVAGLESQTPREAASGPPEHAHGPAAPVDVAQVRADLDLYATPPTGPGLVNVTLTAQFDALNRILDQHVPALLGAVEQRDAEIRRYADDRDRYRTAWLSASRDRRKLRSSLARVKAQWDANYDSRRAAKRTAAAALARVAELETAHAEADTTYYAQFRDSVDADLPTGGWTSTGGPQPDIDAARAVMARRRPHRPEWEPMRVLRVRTTRDVVTTEQPAAAPDSQEET